MVKKDAVRDALSDYSRIIDGYVKHRNRSKLGSELRWWAIKYKKDPKIVNVNQFRIFRLGRKI